MISFTHEIRVNHENDAFNLNYLDFKNLRIKMNTEKNETNIATNKIKFKNSDYKTKSRFLG